MANPITKYIGIVKSAMGQKVRTAPTATANVIRSVAVGGSVEIAFIAEFSGVPYARVIPDGWMRVAESDNSTVYLEVVDIPEELDPIARALNRIADALERK